MHPRPCARCRTRVFDPTGRTRATACAKRVVAASGRTAEKARSVVDSRRGQSARAPSADGRRVFYARGLCTRHYQRLTKQDALPPPEVGLSKLEAQILQRVALILVCGIQLRPLTSAFVLACPTAAAVDARWRSPITLRGNPAAPKTFFRSPTDTGRTRPVCWRPSRVPQETAGGVVIVAARANETRCTPVESRAPWVRG